MLTHLRPALVMIVLMTILTGGLYPLVVTGVAQGLMRSPASGSLLRDDKGAVIGSALIGQAFAKPEYLHGRPSAAGNGYDPTASGGSNYGPLEPKLADRIKADAAAFAKDAPGATIPSDAVTASGSGLDPDVSPETARLQVPRIAAARHVAESAVQAVIDEAAKGRTAAILGEPRVNVLSVNRVLDARASPASEISLVNRAVILPAAALLVFAVAGAAHAQTQETPPPATAPAADELPSICTDRPTKVFSTCTVDPGHLQLEADVFNGSFLRLGGVTTDTYLVTNPTLKYGLTKSLDIEANITPYVVVRSHGAGVDSTVGGVGDLYLRAKYAAFASADGKFAVSIVPYVKAPIARAGIGNGEVEGGSALAVSYKLSDVWTLALAPEVDAYADSAGSGRHVNHVEVINIGRSLPNNITLYGELWGDWNYDPAGTIRQYSADLAVAWGLSKYLQLDGGLNFGLNRYTPGVQAYVGVARKF